MKAKADSLIVTKFYVKRNFAQALAIAWLAAIASASSLIGFVAAYPTVQSRLQLEQMFGNNVGLKILLGTPHNISSIGGFVAWRSLGILVLVGSIWGFMIATRLFRGEEQAGRTELILAGQTTARLQAVKTILSMFILLTIIFVIVLMANLLSINYKNVDYSLAQVAYFALTLVSCIAIFMSIGVLASQLFSTRAAALRFSAFVFGIFFLLRALGAALTGASWLLNISPLGWIENMQPFVSESPIWLVPIIALIALCLGASIFLAGKRDVGSSIIADSDSAKASYWLLGSAMGLRIRLAKGVIIGWLAGLAILSFIFGTVVKSAGEAFASSVAMQDILNRITASKHTGENTFFGLVFMIFGVAIMLMIIGMLSSMRDEEAEGYLDNIIVRPVARLSVLLQHLLLMTTTIVMAVGAVVVFGWLGSRSQHAMSSFTDIYLAVPAICAGVMLVLGFGVFIYGFWPRIMSSMLYGLIIWSFLLEMIGSVLNLNHWVLDTSLLHHIPLVPAVSMRWDTFWIFCISAIIFASLGVWRFVNRDIALN